MPPLKDFFIHRYNRETGIFHVPWLYFIVPLALAFAWGYGCR